MHTLMAHDDYIDTKHKSFDISIAESKSQISVDVDQWETVVSRHQQVPTLPTSACIQ